MNMDILLAFIISSVILTLTPGPDIIYVISQSITKGKKAAIKVSLGLTSGLIIHTFFVVIGLSFLISQNEVFFFVLKLIGGGYFFYLAYKSIRKDESSSVINKKNNSNNFFKTGLFMNLLNPKVSIFFIALFPGFIFHEMWSNKIQFIILGFIFWFQATLIFILVSIFSKKIKNLISSEKVKESKIKLIEALVYTFISIWIFNG
tara:strand:- start:383 stop:994 length:612 start_codon:yes stop_codon:yes gene_type:complete